MKSCVTISLVAEAKGGPFVFWEDLGRSCASAARLGFDAVEVFAPDGKVLRTPALPALLAEHGLKLAAAGTGAGWVIHRWHLTHPDATVRERARGFIGEIIDAAGPHGAPAIIGSMQGRHEGDVARDQALEWLAQGLKDLGERAAVHGVPLLYEPLNRYETNLFNRLGDSVEFLKGSGIANVKLLADLFHMNIEEESIAGALSDAGDHVGHIHFVDSNRRPAGRGHIDFALIAKSLKEMNYERYLSAEAFPFPNSEEAAQQTMKAFRELV